MAMAQQAQPFNRDPQKYKKNRFSHTANTRYGMGDSYGMGIKAKVGRMRDGGIEQVSPNSLKKPPKSLA